MNQIKMSKIRNGTAREKIENDGERFLDLERNVRANKNFVAFVYLASMACGFVYVHCAMYISAVINFFTCNQVGSLVFGVDMRLSMTDT